jgi:hypothetical protein
LLRLGIDIFPCLAQSGLGRRQARVVLQRLLDQGVERRRVKQRPPLARNVQILDEALRLAALHIRRAGLLGQRLWRITGDVRCSRLLEIRPDGAIRQQ